MGKYILVNADGIHEIEVEKMPTREEIAKMVGIPGKETHTYLVNSSYSDPWISIIMDLTNEQTLQPNCKTSLGIVFNGQIAVIRIDPEVKDYNFLTPEQIEIVKQETQVFEYF